jgi:uncharacterized protein (DUF305 family)
MKLSQSLIKVFCTSALLMSFSAQAEDMSKDHSHDMKGSDSLMHSMDSGMQEMKSMTMTGDVDKDFAMMMKMHHQHGVDMAKIEMEQGKSPEMKAMAKKIIAAQKKEIAELDKWLAKQK